MACNIHLVPTSSPADGRWFLTEAPAGFGGTLYVSCLGGTPWVANNDLPDPTLPLDAGCGDPSDIYVQPAPVLGTYVFTFVSPSSDDATTCDGSPCGGCATFTIEIVESPEPVAPLEICQQGPNMNLFDIAGLSCTDYTVDYSFGSPEDVDFDLVDVCPGTYGDFVPSEITPDTYMFTFTHRNTIDGCDTCDVTLEITIDAQPFTGYDQEDTLCLI